MAPTTSTTSTSTAHKPGSSSTTGISSLPISKVHKIIKADKDVKLCSKEAIFLISKATEYMIQKITEQSYAQARISKRPRTIKYQDLAQVAQRNDFYYLSDIVPLSIPLSKALNMRNKILQGVNGEELVEVNQDGVGVGVGGEKAVKAKGNGVGNGSHIEGEGVEREQGNEEEEGKGVEAEVEEEEEDSLPIPAELKIRERVETEGEETLAADVQEMQVDH